MIRIYRRKAHEELLILHVAPNNRLQMNRHAYVKLLWEKFKYTYIYSQVHKYWDIDTILTFLALYTTTMDFKWNEQDVL